MTTPGAAGAWSARAYAIAAAGVVAIAALLRFWHVERLGISHWDAGTFLAGPLEVGPYARADLAIFYAPPLVPELFRLLHRCFGVVDTPAIAAVALFGVATVALAWHAGRSWVGAPAAPTSAAALAAMEYHLLLSRQALTDVPFTFFFTAFAWALSAGVASGKRTSFVLAGVASAAAQWTKYHGFFTLVFAALWLALASFAGRLRDEETRRALRGGAIAAALAAAAGIALALVIETRVGIAELRANNVRWLAPLGLYVFPKTALFVAQCVTSWVSPFVWAPGLLGFARMALRRSRGDLLLLAWTTLFAGALPFYMSYPRLVVPLLVPLALAAGVGLEGLAQLVLARVARARAAPSQLPFAAALALAALVLVPGALASRDALAVRDRGYAEAAEFLRSQPPSPEPDLMIAQHALLPYLHGSGQAVEVADEPGALERLREGRYRFVVADLRLAKPANEELARAIRELGLELVRTIENPLPESALVNSSGFEALELWRSRLDLPLEFVHVARLPPEERRRAEELRALATIRVWRRPQAAR
jgi:hypothetical protein